MGLLRVRNWDTWQKYRTDQKSPPPWIRLHRRILQDPDIMSLSPADRWCLVGIWILAADRNGCVTDDKVALSRLLGLDTPAPIDRLLSLQLLEKIKKRRNRSVTDVDQSCYTSVPHMDPRVEESRSEKRRDHPPNGPPKGTEYPSWFESIWDSRARRPGDNKRDAFKAAEARRKQGVDPLVMLAGTQRYKRYIVETGAEGTEYVKRMATFLGPSRHFESDWTPPAQPKRPNGGMSAVERVERANAHLLDPQHTTFAGEFERD